VRLIGEASDIELSLKEIDDKHTADRISCGIIRKAEELWLTFPDGVEFALLSKQATKPLENIVS
jgi:hypothetical protein